MNFIIEVVVTDRFYCTCQCQTSSSQRYCTWSEVKVKFNVALTATLLNETNADVYGLADTILYIIIESRKKGGGVSLFIKENIKYIDRDELLHMNDYIECVFIGLEKGEMGLGWNAVIRVIYRPPGTEIKIFNEHLQGNLQGIDSENKKCYLLGDYNINLLNVDKHSDTNEFLDMMYAHSLFPNITNPRIYGIFLNPTSEEIRNIIKLLINGSSGWDEISAKIIKFAFSPLLKTLCHIFNLSLYTGVFPGELKLAKVVPLYKAGDAQKFSNNRPVSVLPIFAKVLERLMYNR